MDSQSTHEQLLDPATYSEPTRKVEFRETHISRVYLTDTHAYKFKKPLDLGFLDFSTLEQRKHFCAEEVRLNRRFAPDVYLGVIELRARQGLLGFGHHGQLIDFAVHMRRLPEERMLDQLIDAVAAELPVEIERLARHLAPLLASSPICHSQTPGGNAADIHTNCMENLTQTQSAIGAALSAQAHRMMTGQTLNQLERLTPLFREREARGYVRDGHGDLHSRNICMTDPIQVYDCIEFCRRFRIADIAAELAFLLMDLDARGRGDLGRIFLAAYQQQAADPDLTTLLPFYKSYRAWVRGKVESLLANEIEVAPEARRTALLRSCRYFNLALGYHLPPMLLLTTGLMGTGKTTFAQAMAGTLGAELLRSDVIRKELAGISPTRPGPDAFGQGLYAPEMTARTYAELLHRANRLLRQGKTVVVDASFSRAAERQRFFNMAGRRAVPVRMVHLHCDRAVAAARLDRRQARGQDASDGRQDLLEDQASAFEPVPCDPRMISIDSSAAVDYTVQDVICQLLTG